MALSDLLPKLDNAGRRLVLAEILGEPVGSRLAKKARSQKNRQQALVSNTSSGHHNKDPQVDTESFTIIKGED